MNLFSKYAWVVPLKDKKNVLLLLMHFKVFQTARKEKQTKHELINVVNFITVLFKNG